MNIIPKSNAEVTTLAALAVAGAQAHGADVRLKHNTAAHLWADFFALTGDPSAPEIPGAQARLDAQLRLMRETYATLQSVLRAARTFCFIGIGFLRPRFGQHWNSDWKVAGFKGPSLAVPAVPLALLIEFRAFLAGNPDASVEYGFTADDAQRHIDAIQSARLARENARGWRWSIKRERDAAFRKLRKRLSNLRAELALLLPPTDDRWYAFGFRRPADGQSPGPVRGVTAAPIVDGQGTARQAARATAPSEFDGSMNLATESGDNDGADPAAKSESGTSEPVATRAVHVEWRHSTRAESYRVGWRVDQGMVAGPDGGHGAETLSDPKHSIITADEQVTLLGIPANAPVIITVSARNQTGETRPAALRLVAFD